MSNSPANKQHKSKSTHQADMLQELATVVETHAGWVSVEVELKSACNHCSNNESCGTSTIAKAFSVKTQRFSIQSDLPCKQGDMLEIGLPESVVLKAAAVVYLLPLLGLFLFAAIGHMLAVNVSLNTDITAMVFAAVGAVFAWRLGKSIAKQLEQASQPIILRNLGQKVSAL